VLDFDLRSTSRVLTKDGVAIDCNSVVGTPAPGCRLCFPTIQPRFYNSQTGKYAYLLIKPSGSRVELRQTTNGSNIYQAADSSYLQLVDYGSTLYLQPTDGSLLTYTLVNSAYRCGAIKDRNG